MTGNALQLPRPMQLPLILAVIAIALCVASSLLVETLTWWIRSLSSGSDVGAYMAKTNIFFYGGRVFYLVFTTVAALLVDLHVGTRTLVTIFALAFILTAAMHALLLAPSTLVTKGLTFLARRLGLTPKSDAGRFYRAERSDPLVNYTAAASLFYTCGLGIPYVVASLVPNLRLTVANTGQVMTAVSMVLILFLIDQRLFVSLDRGELDVRVRTYTLGRILGIGAAGVAFLVALLLGI